MSSRGEVGGVGGKEQMCCLRVMQGVSSGGWINKVPHPL